MAEMQFEVKYLQDDNAPYKAYGSGMVEYDTVQAIGDADVTTAQAAKILELYSLKF